MSNLSLAKVAFNQANAKVPVGATIINNLIMCFQNMLKVISKELKMAKLIVAVIDIWTGPNKQSYIGVIFSYLSGKCQHPLDDLHSCERNCLKFYATCR